MVGGGGARHAPACFCSDEGKLGQGRWDAGDGAHRNAERCRWELGTSRRKKEKGKRLRSTHRSLHGDGGTDRCIMACFCLQDLLNAGDSSPRDAGRL